PTKLTRLCQVWNDPICYLDPQKSDLSSRRRVTQPDSEVLFLPKIAEQGDWGFRFISLLTSDSSEGNRGCGEEQGRGDRRLSVEGIAIQRACSLSRCLEISQTLSPNFFGGAMARSFEGAR
ncbi:hypothetical protein U1Q18_017771, partial [Sarracenia purpurea var. burkii]